MKLQNAHIKMANKYLNHLKGHVVFPTGLLNAKREQAQKDEAESVQTAKDLEKQVKSLPSSSTFRRYPELSSSSCRDWKIKSKSPSIAGSVF